MSNHRCGTCDYFKCVCEGAEKGECKWIAAHLLPVAIHASQTYMLNHEGEFCPCWEKQKEEEEKIKWPENEYINENQIEPEKE